ncbi:MAG: sulfate adenylyltransferase, partial [Chthoniobacterales bacterium]
VFKPGDTISVMPSGFSTTIDKIYQPGGKEIAEAFAPQSVVMTLKDEIDISRGDMLVKANNPPSVGQDVEAMVCWFSQKPMEQRGKYLLRHTTKESKVIVQELLYQVDFVTVR